MFGSSQRFNGTGSKAYAFESAFCRASFAFLLLVIDVVVAASIFAFTDVLGVPAGILVSILVSLIIIAILLLVQDVQSRPGLSAA